MIEYIPCKGSEHRSSLRGRTHMAKANANIQEYRKRNESGEPEDHRHSLNAQDRKFVV